MRGLDALAKALLTQSDRIYTVPGFPITRLGELTNAEMVINEKTALEYALGTRSPGSVRRSLSRMLGLMPAPIPSCRLQPRVLSGE